MSPEFNHANSFARAREVGESLFDRISCGHWDLDRWRFRLLIAKQPFGEFTRANKCHYVARCADA